MNQQIQVSALERPLGQSTASPRLEGNWLRAARLGWIILALVVTTLILANLYRNHIEEHFDAHVFTHVEELVAAVEAGPGGELQLVGQPTDPRFYHLNSGWYWEVRKAGKSLGKSASLGEFRLDLQELKMGESRDVQIVYGPQGEELRRHLDSTGDSEPLAERVAGGAEPELSSRGSSHQHVPHHQRTCPGSLQQPSPHRKREYRQRT